MVRESKQQVEFREACKAAAGEKDLPDRVARLALAFAMAELERLLGRDRAEDFDDAVAIFTDRVVKHWRKMAAARNPSAFVTVMARNALRDWMRTKAVRMKQDSGLVRRARTIHVHLLPAGRRTPGAPRS